MAVEEINAQGGGRARAVAVDAASKDDLRKLVDTAHDAFGPIHIVFNNAAAGVVYASLPPGVDVEVVKAGTGAGPTENDVVTVSRVGEGWEGRLGRIDEGLLRAAMPSRDACCLVCGPPQLTECRNPEVRW